MLREHRAPTSYRQAIISKRQVAFVIKPHLAAVAAVNTQRSCMAHFCTVDL